MSITVRCFNATSIYCLTASKGVWQDCSCWRKKWGCCMSGLSAAQRPVISPACCVQSHMEQYRWDCAAAQPQMQSRHYNPDAFCGFGSPFGLANLPSEIISIIRCIGIFLCLNRWKTVTTRTQCCVIQQWAVTAPWNWQAFTLLVHECPQSKNWLVLLSLVWK